MVRENILELNSDSFTFKMCFCLFPYHLSCCVMTKNEIDKEEEKENKSLQFALLSHAPRPEKHKENIKEMPYIGAYAFMTIVFLLHFCNLFPCISLLLSWTAQDRDCLTRFYILST